MDNRLRDQIVEMAALHEKAGVQPGEIMAQIAAALGCIGAGFMMNGAPRQGVHDLFERAMTVMVSQADSIVGIHNLLKKEGKQ